MVAAEKEDAGWKRATRTPRLLLRGLALRELAAGLVRGQQMRWTLGRMYWEVLDAEWGRNGSPTRISSSS